MVLFEENVLRILTRPSSIFLESLQITSTKRTNDYSVNKKNTENL